MKNPNPGEIRRFGIIGLGKMGGGLALQAIEKGWQVAGFTQGGATDELRQAGLREAAKLKDLLALLPRPRAVFLYIPAGPAIDATIQELLKGLDEGDVIVDGGNSYWGDSRDRAARLREHGVRFVDLGTSGGIEGARHGACFMAGGEADAVALIEPILRSLAVREGFVHAGPPGAGHFTKLVHNGIEFGMLQAIGEGMALLEKFPGAALPVAPILGCWNHGSVIRSWLIELMQKALLQEGKLDAVPSFIEDTGEVNWLVADALHFEVPVPVIAQSIMQLFASRDARQPAARAIAMMRHGFGGHPYGPAAGIARERREGRIADPFLAPMAAAAREH